MHTKWQKRPLQHYTFDLLRMSGSNCKLDFLSKGKVNLIASNLKYQTNVANKWTACFVWIQTNYSCVGRDHFIPTINYSHMICGRYLSFGPLPSHIANYSIRFYLYRAQRMVVVFKRAYNDKAVVIQDVCFRFTYGTLVVKLGNYTSSSCRATWKWRFSFCCFEQYFISVNVNGKNENALSSSSSPPSSSLESS